MTLATGSRLGPYEILAPLGAGGQGEVFRARDTRLSRDVALKVLPDHLQDDPKALARFENEARAVAALSHPHILAIHDFGRTDGTSFAVTELLEGDTLRAALRNGALPLKKVLDLSAQLADALAAAHDKGVVHRDLKPENVFLTRDGVVKLLDFGLARRESPLVSPDDTRSPTLSLHTSPGLVVGTVAYMSPEQTRGLAVDHRSDQFSFGILLYELLAGSRPFQGETAAETLTAILRHDPEPLDRRNASVPPPLAWIVERLLAKDPADRYAATRDLAHDLAALRTRLAGAGLSADRHSPEDATRLRSRRLRRTALFGSVVAIAVVATAIATTHVGRAKDGEVRPAARFEIHLPEGRYIPSQSLALSPDGTVLVFAGFEWKEPWRTVFGPRLYSRRLDSLESVPVPGADPGFFPGFSPDGRHVSFLSASAGALHLRRVPLSGGTPRTICACDAHFGTAWTPADTILFASVTGPLQEVPAEGGTPRPATRLDVEAGEVSHRLPHLLPDGRTVLYTSLRWVTEGMTWQKARVYAQRLGEPKRTLILEGGSDARWVPPGHLVFAREGTLLAAPFDAERLRLKGPAVVVVENVRHSIHTGDSSEETGAATVTIGRTGVVSWSPGSVEPPYTIPPAWYDETGKPSPLAGEPVEGPVLSKQVSRDGGRILLSYNYAGTQIEVLDSVRGSRRRVTFDENPLWATWGPGADRFTFTSDHEGPVAIYSRGLDGGSRPAERIWTSPDGSALALGSWSPDGRRLAFVRTSPSTGPDIWLLETGREARPVVASRFAEMHPEISPDGRWLLYTSDSPGSRLAFARSLQGDGPEIPVSVGQGFEPRWSKDGRSIYYWQYVKGALAVQALFRVAVSTRSDSLELGAPERLFESRRQPSTPGHSWDVAPDGRILFGFESIEGRRARLEKMVSSRIVVDTGGLARLANPSSVVP